MHRSTMQIVPTTVEPLSICNLELRLAAGHGQGWLRLQVEAGGEVDSGSGSSSGWAKARRVATAQVHSTLLIDRTPAAWCTW